MKNKLNLCINFKIVMKLSNKNYKYFKMTNK